MGAFLDAVKALRLFPRPYPNNVVPAEVSGGYYGPLVPVNSTFSTGVVAGGADVLFAVPFITEVGGPVTSLAFRNTSAGESGNLIRTGIYTDNAGRPDTLVAEASVTTLTAAAALREPTISATLSPNTRYWFSGVTNASVTVTTFNALFPYTHETSFGNYLWRNNLDISATGMLSRVFAYAALPASWGTPGAGSLTPMMFAWKKT